MDADPFIMISETRQAEREDENYSDDGFQEIKRRDINKCSRNYRSYVIDRKRRPVSSEESCVTSFVDKPLQNLIYRVI